MNEVLTGELVCIQPLKTHTHHCPECGKDWEHEDASRLRCYDRCWPCWMKAKFQIDSKENQ